MASSSTAGSLPKSNPSTIRDKFLVGYQGWFACPGDGEPLQQGHHGFSRWFTQPLPDGGHPTIDYWPDTTEYTPSELYEAPGLTSGPENEPTRLFSSRNQATVTKHFRWMAEVAVDGVFLQRNLYDFDMERMGPARRGLRDEVGNRVREAAESEGRVFAYMYDITGVESARVQHIIEEDWKHLVNTNGVLSSSSYLRERGSPVVAVRGLGSVNSGHTPEMVHQLAQFFRRYTPGGVYLIAGTPAHWRTSNNDADPNPALVNMYLDDFDMISPWTVRQYTTIKEIDKFADTVVKGDVELLGQRNQDGVSSKVDYMPVVFPGYSAHNMYAGRRPLNEIPRHGGKFLWQQIFNVKRLGARVLFGAMWDQYDDGTALLPIVEKSRNLPKSASNYRFLALDDDGFDLTNDWYMRVCGYAAEGMRAERRIFETFPSKELQDFWGTRPKYTEPDASAPASSSSAGYTQWKQAQNEDSDEPPPPPYSLEADHMAAQAPASTTTIPSPAAPVSFAQSAPAPLSTAPSSIQVSELSNLPASTVGRPASQGNEVEQLAQRLQGQHIMSSGHLPPGAQSPPNQHVYETSPLPQAPQTNLLSSPSISAGRPHLSPSPSVSAGRPQPSPSPSVSSSRPSLSPSPSLSGARPPVHPSHLGARPTQSSPPYPPLASSQTNHHGPSSNPIPSFPLPHSNPSAPLSTSHVYPSASTYSYPPMIQPAYPPSVSHPHEASPYQSPYPPHMFSAPIPVDPTYRPSPEHGSSHLHHSSSISAGKRPQTNGAPSHWPPAEWGVQTAAPTSHTPPFPSHRPPTASPPGSVAPSPGPTGQSQFPSAPGPAGFSPLPGPAGYSGFPASPGPSGYTNFPSSPGPAGYPSFSASQGSAIQSSHSPSPGPYNSYQPGYPPASPGFGNPHLQHGQANPQHMPSSQYSGEWHPPPTSPPPHAPHHAPSSHSPYPPQPGVGTSQHPHHNPGHGHHASYGSSYDPPSKPVASPPPNLPPRPPNHGHAPSVPTRPPNSTPGPGGIAIPGFAVSAFDKFAGQKQRQQLESTVNNLAQSGTKLFQKFTK